MDIRKWRCERIVDRFLRHDFHYRFDEKRHVFSLTVVFGGKAGTMNVIIAVQDGVVNCMATLPFRGSAPTASKLAEFVCRVNSHLSFGHLDYDFDDGEVNFAYDLTFAQLKAEKARRCTVSSAAPRRWARSLVRSSPCLRWGMATRRNCTKWQCRGLA